MIYDAIIIGGGAAGLFCAFQAGRRGKRVLVIEHNAEVGRKILISGGGRCNFTNIHTKPENFISANPHFCKSALSRYSPEDLVQLVKKHRIPFYEKKLGQLFCSDTSRRIVDMLTSECRSAGVEIRTGCEVKAVDRDTDFHITTNRDVVRSGSLVVACGGLSFRKIGATDLGYRIARQFKLKIVETRPSLVAMVLAGGGRSDLAGVAIDADVRAGNQSFRENILFTHRGLSGPAILQISNYWRKDDAISIDLLPEMNAAELLGDGLNSQQMPVNFLSKYLPNRFTHALGGEMPNKPVSQLTVKEITNIATRLNSWQVRFSETEGYDRAEVTLGGVSTAELSSTSMEAKRVPGLYFIGEVVDVTGWLGGYNFQWAWASGFAAGNAL